MRLKLNQSGFSAVEAILLIVIIGIIGGTGLFVYHVKTSSDAVLNSANQLAKSSATATKPVVKNFYDCADIYSKIHGTEPTACDYNGVHYVIPATYTNDMIRGYDLLPDALKQPIESLARTIFSCKTPAPLNERFLSEIIATKVSAKEYDIDVSCISGYHVVYTEAANGQWQAGPPRN